ncbi:hypothetical protein [Suttonella ornithocola]|uniref:Uncharacterized protein n=1 Tax=Suttonella ornithocola TaxID=279832 RepID=A0A380MZP0_9GAMM|nr:hypothetical protein [Suttonella ornithocola]SUO97343.1 Uncharacterised protein [Suttonella ornithocola]
MRKVYHLKPQARWRILFQSLIFFLFLFIFIWIRLWVKPHLTPVSVFYSVIVFLFLFPLVKATLALFSPHAKGLVLSERGIEWAFGEEQGFLFWESVMESVFEEERVILRYSGGAQFSSEPVLGEPIPRNFEMDASVELPLSLLKGQTEEIVAQIRTHLE